MNQPCLSFLVKRRGRAGVDGYWHASRYPHQGSFMRSTGRQASTTSCGVLCCAGRHASRALSARYAPFALIESQIRLEKPGITTLGRTNQAHFPCRRKVFLQDDYTRVIRIRQAPSPAQTRHINPFSHICHAGYIGVLTLFRRKHDIPSYLTYRPLDVVVYRPRMINIRFLTNFSSMGGIDPSRGG